MQASLRMAAAPFAPSAPFPCAKLTGDHITGRFG